MSITNKLKKHIVSLFIGRYAAVLFDSSRTKYVLKDDFNKVKDRSSIHNIFRIQTDDSLMYRFYCITFIEYMTQGMIQVLLE